MNEKEIIEKIKAHRIDYGLTQKEASEKMGYISNRFYHFEKGHIRITLELLNRMREVFGWEF